MPVFYESPARGQARRPCLNRGSFQGQKVPLVLWEHTENPAQVSAAASLRDWMPG